MATENWQISGQYFETCSCDFICPCITSNLSARPTQGSCTFALVFGIERGHYGSTSLDGIKFAVIGYTPEAMANGNWSLGLIADDGASADQREAVAAIAGGQAGGPLANLAPLIGDFRGIESASIQLQHDGLSWSVAIPGLLDQAAEGVAGANPAEPLYLDNTPHPANSRLAVARATRSHLSAFGLNWDDDSGRNNGHFAPFAWSGP